MVDIKQVMAHTPTMLLVSPSRAASWRLGALANGADSGLAGIGSSDGGYSTIFGLISTAACGALAYHGYKRKNTVGGALLWGLLGGLVWPITLPIAFGQGFGKPKAK